MSAKAFLEGIQILAKYYTDLEYDHFTATEEGFGALPLDREISPEDEKRLKALGFVQRAFGLQQCWKADL
jgi:hypothetical protein